MSMPALDLIKLRLTAFRRDYTAFLLSALQLAEAMEKNASNYGTDTKHPQLLAIVERVSAELNIPSNLIFSNIRTVPVSDARHMAMLVCRETTDFSLHELGSFFQRDHAAVINAVRKCLNLLATDRRFKSHYDKIRAALPKAA